MGLERGSQSKAASLTLNKWVKRGLGKQEWGDKETSVQQRQKEHGAPEAACCLNV